MGLTRVLHDVSANHQVLGDTEESPLNASDYDSRHVSSLLLSMVCGEPCVRTFMGQSDLSQTHEHARQVGV